MTETTLRVALAQIRSGDDPDENLAMVRRLSAEASAQAARLVVFPEATMVRFGGRPRAAAETHAERWRTQLRSIAAEHGVVLVVGIFVPADKGKVRNRVVVTDGVELDEHYDKVHLFDAMGSRESDHTEAGHQPLVVDALDTRIGIATCYDVRFAEQFLAMARDGAELVCLPTAWADGERKAEQWELLVRARAMDAQAFVLGCDQAFDPGARLSFGVGRSLVAGPLGEVLVEAGEAEELLVVDLPLAEPGRVRESVPALAWLPER